MRVVPTEDFICPKSGVKVPADLTALMVDPGSVKPNTWNPNKMDSFMRGKLIASIKKDGFILPVLVRPYAGDDEGVQWEIVDGEHRWDVAVKDLGMEQIPILNLGDISDADAKAITVKANSLRGEFDSVKLAEMVKGLVDERGMQAIADELPYTAERLGAMVDLLKVDVGGLTVNDQTPAASDEEKPADEFKAFTGEGMKMEHKCPRCGFEFNDDKK